MKKYSIVIILLLACAFLFTQASFAEEKVGFVKKVWRDILDLVKKYPGAVIAENTSREKADNKPRVVLLGKPGT